MSSGLSLSVFLLLSLLCLSFFLSTPSFVSASSDDDSDLSDDVDSSDELDSFDEIEVDETSEQDFNQRNLGEDEMQYNFMSHPDVATSVYFPSHPDKVFEIGTEITALIGFTNTGSSKIFNLTFAGANLLSPEDSSYYIQNFSVIQVPHQLVEPGHEVTIEYKFQTAEALEAAEYRLAAWILYNGTEGGVFFNTYFNQTVEMVEKDKGILGNLSRFATILVILGVIGAGSYGAYTAATGGTKKKRKPRVPEGEKKPAPEWEVQAYKPATKQKAFGAKKRSQKKETTNAPTGSGAAEQAESSGQVQDE